LSRADKKKIIRIHKTNWIGKKPNFGILIFLSKLEDFEKELLLALKTYCVREIWNPVSNKLAKR
jgi:hypothetical protein